MKFCKEKLKQLINDNNLTYCELAKMLDVSADAVSKWCLGRNQPTKERIKQIADLFDVSLEELMSDESKESVVNIKKIQGEFDSEKFRQIFHEKGLNYSDFGKLLGVSHDTVSRWCTGKHKPKEKSLHQIAKALQIPVEDLLVSNNKCMAEEKEMKEMIRNGSGCIDLTAFQAINNIEKTEGISVNRGEIWEVEGLKGDGELVVVIGIQEKFCNVLLLKETNMNTSTEVQVNARGIRYTDPGLLSYRNKSELPRLIQRIRAWLPAGVPQAGAGESIQRADTSPLPPATESTFCSLFC